MVINLLLTKYQPSSVHYLTCFAAILALVFIAKKLKFRIPNIIETRITPQRYGFYWALWGIAFFTGFYLVSAITPLPLIPIIVGLMLGYMSLILSKSLDKLSWCAFHRYSLYLGVTMILLFIDVIQAFMQLNMERAVTVITVVVMLAIMYKRIKPRQMCNVY